MDQRQLSQEAVGLIQSSLNARSVTMFLYSKRGLLVPRASKGVAPPGADAEAYAPGDDLVGSCATGVGGDRFGEMIVTAEPFADTSPQFQRVFRSVIKANTEIAYVPLNGPNRTYGVIRCIAGQTSDGHETPFGIEDLGDLKVFTHQVSISLSSLRRKLELDILADVNKLLTDRPDDVRRVYDLVTQALVEESTEYAACSIRIRNSGNLVLESLSPASGMNMIDKDRLARRPDTGFSRDAFESREPVIIRDVQNRLVEFHDPNWVEENNFVTAAVFPIYLDEEYIGVLALYLWYAYDFYPTKQEFLKNLCQHVATATRVVRLLTTRQLLIERMSAIVSHSGTANELLQTILDGACEVTGAWQGYISMVERRDSKLHPRVTTANLSSGDVPMIDVDGPGLTALAVRSQKSVLRGDVTKDRVYVDFDGDASGKTRSELVTPLVYERKVLGVIAVESDQVDYFSISDQLLLETLAQYATLIFQRDRLYDATKTLANVDFSRASQDLMTVIAKSAADLVDADAAILRTYSSALNELLFESHYPADMNIVDVAQAMPRTAGACWDSLTLKDVVLFKNLPHNESFHNKAFVTTNGYTEMVSVPLLLPGSDAEHPTELGVINVFFRTPSPYFDFERRLLRVLGVSASYAIHDLSLIEESKRTQALATITARTTAAVELSSQLAHQALDPLRNARTAMELIDRAVRHRHLRDIPTPLAKLQQHLAALESLVARLAPSERPKTDYTEVLSDAFRLIHTNLFAGSDRPHLHIGESELWEHVTEALTRVLDLVKLPVAAAFLSAQRDYSDMRRVAVTRTGAAVRDHIALRSFEEFASLTEQTHVVLPRKDGHFAWLDPRLVVGTPGAVLYGHQVTGGKVLIIALGLPEGRILTFEELATLYETVAVQIFTYVDNAMFGIELDFLTSETGHLMGRAIGKVEIGTRELLSVLTVGPDADHEMLALARSAIEDGINRLQLIHNNFYGFSVQRKMLDSGSSATTGAVDGGNQRVDVQSMLEALMPMFSREAVERRLSPTRFFGAREKKAIVVGPADPLRLTFLNLYDNAVKFAYNDTHIDIWLRIEDGQCIISFENLGTGVAPDEFVTVFDRLRRSRYQDRSKRTEGLGLGLSYCRRVVQEIFHGQIALNSRPAMTPKRQRPYEGYNYLTTVTMTLPLAPEGENNSA